VNSAVDQSFDEERGQDASLRAGRPNLQQKHRHTDSDFIVLVAGRLKIEKKLVSSLEDTSIIAAEIQGHVRSPVK